MTVYLCVGWRYLVTGCQALNLSANRLEYYAEPFRAKLLLQRLIMRLENFQVLLIEGRIATETHWPSSANESSRPMESLH